MRDAVGYTVFKGHPVNTDNRAIRYGSISIALHWLMLLLIAVVYACMELRGYFPKGSDSVLT
jgi:superoxide oxidase